jgi:hypothetical protein
VSYRAASCPIRPKSLQSIFCAASKTLQAQSLRPCPKGNHAVRNSEQLADGSDKKTHSYSAGIVFAVFQADDLAQKYFMS